MCSLNNDEYEIGEDFMHKDDVEVKVGVMCRKCTSNKAQVILRGKDAYCQKCFLASATHKFRAALGKFKTVRPTDSVLVAHSGKTGSTVLLHLIKSGMHEHVHKRLVFKTTVLYIDEGAVKDQTLEERRSTMRAVAEQIRDLGFTGYTTSLNQCLRESDPEVQMTNSPDIQTAEDEALTKAFDALPNYTMKEELLCKLRERLLILIARKLGCNKVFVAESITGLAIKTLSNISVGRGAHLPLDVAFIDARYSDVMLLRPVQDFTNKELVYYLNFHNLKVVQSPELTTKKDPYVSIRKLTERFVTGLDSEFHGTVSTVFRTCEKLSTKGTKLQSTEEICVLCNAPLDTAVSADLSAIRATAFSRFVSLDTPSGKLNSDSGKSTVTFDKVSPDGNECSNCDGCNCAASSKSLQISVEDLKKCLCYGCRLIFQDPCTLNSVPSFVLNAVQRRLSLENMRREINDFLL